MYTVREFAVKRIDSRSQNPELRADSAHACLSNNVAMAARAGRRIKGNPKFVTSE